RAFLRPPVAAALARSGAQTRPWPAGLPRWHGPRRLRPSHGLHLDGPWPYRPATLKATGKRTSNTRSLTYELSKNAMRAARQAAAARECVESERPRPGGRAQAAIEWR